MSDHIKKAPRFPRRLSLKEDRGGAIHASPQMIWRVGTVFARVVSRTRNMQISDHTEQVIRALTDGAVGGAAATAPLWMSLVERSATLVIAIGGVILLIGRFWLFWHDVRNRRLDRRKRSVPIAADRRRSRS